MVWLINVTNIMKQRGRTHTSLTETAALVVRELNRIPNIKMIAPGEISPNARRQGGARFITIVYTNAGFEMIITGQSTQKVAVHIDGDKKVAENVAEALSFAKRLRHMEFKYRDRKPGV